jgi:spermidine/putrescine transport system permease protein
MTTAAPVTGTRRRAPVLATITLLYLAWSILPILVAVRIGFNEGKSRSTFQALSTRWYWGDQSSVWHDVSLQGALWNSLQLGVVCVLIAVPLGTGLAIALSRWRGRVEGPVNAITLLPLVTPEIVVGASLLLVFSQAFPFIPRGFPAQLIGHVTLTVTIVVVIVRGRLLLIDTSLEEAARDLGARQAQAFRMVLLPLLLPAIVGAAALTFATSLDDFVTSAFLSAGADSETVPMKLYSTARASGSPAINALGSITLFATLLMIGIAWLVMKLFRTRAATPASESL